MTEAAPNLDEKSPTAGVAPPRQEAHDDLLFLGIPAAARPAWLHLAKVLAASGPAPCEEGLADSWWGAVRDGAKSKNAPSLEQLAARCCLGCPARDACLDYALAADERWGVWGGLTTVERRELASRPRSSSAA